jgi:hypothetical protein
MRKEREEDKIYLLMTSIAFGDRSVVIVGGGLFIS